MKSNQKIKLKQMDSKGYQKIVGGIVALLLMIIVGIMVYWKTQGSISAFEEATETFTEDSDGNSFTRYDGSTGSNFTGETIELDYSAYSISSVYVWNGSGSTAEACTVTTHYTHDGYKEISIVADGRSNFTQVNVTYTSDMANDEDEVSTMATTIFNLLPIVALVVVAAVILGVVLGFGGSSGKKF